MSCATFTMIPGTALLENLLVEQRQVAEEEVHQVVPLRAFCYQEEDHATSCKGGSIEEHQGPGENHLGRGVHG